MRPPLRPSLRLGTCILIVPQRNPLILAKELATPLDQLSGGRVELGLGIGWMREEFDALGIPWPRRGARNDEYIEVMRALWAGPHAEFHGEFVDFEKVTCSPRPVNGDIPILVGGDTDAAIRRAVKLADGYFPGEGNTQRLAELLGRVRTACDRADRDYGTLEINAMFGSQMADPEQGMKEVSPIFSLESDLSIKSSPTRANLIFATPRRVTSPSRFTAGLLFCWPGSRETTPTSLTDSTG